MCRSEQQNDSSPHFPKNEKNASKNCFPFRDLKGKGQGCYTQFFYYMQIESCFAALNSWPKRHYYCISSIYRNKFTKALGVSNEFVLFLYIKGTAHLNTTNLL